MLGTPHQLMIAVRAAGIAAGLAALIALGGPFHYADLGLPFPDTVAHGLLFYGLAVLMLGALPRSRTSDIGWTLVGLAVATEIGQALVGREMSLHDAAGDVMGAALALAPTYMAQFRALVRSDPHARFADLRKTDHRQPATTGLQHLEAASR